MLKMSDQLTLLLTVVHFAFTISWKPAFRTYRCNVFLIKTFHSHRAFVKLRVHSIHSVLV